MATTTASDPNDDDDDVEIAQQHLDWSSKQGRILTANGRATDYYTSQRGFPFTEKELPHYELLQTQMKQTQKKKTNNDDDDEDASLLIVPTRWISSTTTASTTSPICGAWSRLYFMGGWELSTFRDEIVYNIQTNSLFVDLRIPVSRNTLLPKHGVHCLQDYTNTQLRYYARQHVFAGCTRVIDVGSTDGDTDVTDDDDVSMDDRQQKPKQQQQQRPRRHGYCAVRHHVLDWNFVGVPRPRPNKWWIETLPTSQRSQPSQSEQQLCHEQRNNNNSNIDIDMWKEWAYATDDYGQYYYCELWQRLTESESSSTSPSNNNNTGSGRQPQRPMLALRKQQRRNRNHNHQDNDDDEEDGEDGIIVVVGNHFNYIRGRALVKQEQQQQQDNRHPQASSLVELVDTALDNNDRKTALQWLGRIDAGHGRIVVDVESNSKGGNQCHQKWKIDCAIQPWKEGTCLFSGTAATNEDDNNNNNNVVMVEGTDITDCCVVWNEERWNVVDSTLQTVQQVKDLVK